MWVLSGVCFCSHVQVIPTKTFHAYLTCRYLEALGHTCFKRATITKVLKVKSCTCRCRFKKGLWVLQGGQHMQTSRLDRRCVFTWRKVALLRDGLATWSRKPRRGVTNATDLEALGCFYVITRELYQHKYEEKQTFSKRLGTD